MNLYCLWNSSISLFVQAISLLLCCLCHRCEYLVIKLLFWMFWSRLNFCMFWSIFFIFLFWIVCSPTFRRIIRNKSTERFSGLPYIYSLLNCLIVLWYGLPWVTQGVLLVATVNSVGAFFQLTYVIIFIIYSDNLRKVRHGCKTLLFLEIAYYGCDFSLISSIFAWSWRCHHFWLLFSAPLLWSFILAFNSSMALQGETLSDILVLLLSSPCLLPHYSSL